MISHSMRMLDLGRRALMDKTCLSESYINTLEAFTDFHKGVVEREEQRKPCIRGGIERRKIVVVEKKVNEKKVHVAIKGVYYGIVAIVIGVVAYHYAEVAAVTVVVESALHHFHKWI